MDKDRTLRYMDLLILKTIAETLNQKHDMKPMLQSTLEKLLELTGLKTGWIFLADEEPIYHYLADHHLPPGTCGGRIRRPCDARYASV